MPAPFTCEQARAALGREGVSMAEFSRYFGLNKNLVSDLLNGRKKGLRGEAHRAAVLLRIKEGLSDGSVGLLSPKPKDSHVPGQQTNP